MHLFRVHRIAAAAAVVGTDINEEKRAQRYKGRIHIQETAGCACGENPRRSIKLRFDREKQGNNNSGNRVCICLTHNSALANGSYLWQCLQSACSRNSLIDDVSAHRIWTAADTLFICTLICCYSNGALVHDRKNIGKTMLNWIWFCDERNDHGLIYQNRPPASSIPHIAHTHTPWGIQCNVCRFVINFGVLTSRPCARASATKERIELTTRADAQT